jgi:hypothetical protein
MSENLTMEITSRVPHATDNEIETLNRKITCQLQSLHARQQLNNPPSELTLARGL